MKDLRALLIEDSEDDASLVLLQLRRLGYRVLAKRVESLAELHEAIRGSEWDVILSDYNLSDFNAHDVLGALREAGIRTPTIVVSGAIGEELAVELMRQGANDYVLKYHLARLGPVLDRELREAHERERLARERAESESKFRHLVDSNLMAVVLYDSQGVIRDANPAFLALTGYSAEELRTGKIRWESIARHPLPRDRESIRFDDELRPRSGRPVPVSIGAVNFHGNRDEGIAYVLDNRERKRREEEQREAIRVRDEFIAVASHELKTPLTSLKMQSQMLQHLLTKRDGAIERRHLERLLDISTRQLFRLSRLIEDMIDISQLNSGQIRVSLGSGLLRDVLDRALSRFKELYPGMPVGTRVNFPSNTPIYWDQERMAQVLVSLLSNAAKYGEQKPIEIRASLKDLKHAVLEVIDQGQGIAAKDLERIFGRFERATPASHVSGMGLGLYLARGVVSRHRGTISVSSELEHGSVFRVELPLNPCEGQEERNGAA